MKRTAITILFVFAATILFAQQKKYIHKGNELYSRQQYKDAEDDYRKSAADSAKGDKTANEKAGFNLGDALYKQKKYAAAGTEFNKLANTANNEKALAAQAYHNLGNSMLEANKYEQAIDAYKRALLNNPKDDQTRYNLAYAEEKLKKQQQQNKKDQQNKNGKQNQPNKDNKNGNDKNKDNKDQNKQNQGNQNQNKQNQQQQGNQPQPNQISKEDAERMLDALNNEEKRTQDKLKDKRLQGTQKNITKDW